MKNSFSNNDSKISENRKNLNLSRDYGKGKINSANNINNNSHYPNIHLFNNKGQETKNNDYENIDIFLNIKDNQG